MPKRSDISSILIIGAGPIVIGQACEFDYSGAQACKALREEGYRIILANSNPATIMTDPKLADKTYIEPLTLEILTEIIKKERPDAILPTVGGQTALNLAIELQEKGILDEYNVELIGANAEAIAKAEDRQLFKEAMERIGLACPKNTVVNNLEEALEFVKEIGLPAIIRPSFTLGGAGGGIAYTIEEFRQIVANGLKTSPSHQVQIDESIIGWKEYEMEVVRDKKDNCIIICSIENIDPMGVHTGDSITVAPALTLTDKEYQLMRDASFKVLREIGVETGGSNVQFAVNPEDGRMLVIEMNPRVSRSSALASKATGFPIAKIAAKLAVGYTLDELLNDCTKVTPAAFEPVIDYVVLKIPRFTFEKFQGSSNQLSTSMKSVGEAMSVGRNFKEALQKALCSLEVGLNGLDVLQSDKAKVKEQLKIFSPDRLLLIADAFRASISIDEIHEITSVDKWFLRQIEELVEAEQDIIKGGLPDDAEQLHALKSQGFSDKKLAILAGLTEQDIEEIREEYNVKPVYKIIDTCSAEFISNTPYMYSTYEGDGVNPAYCEANPSDRKKIIILGSGPNRIGQGLEFDYACVHACYGLKQAGFETIMINCNPETVSTDYDTPDRLYFEPLTAERVISIARREQENGELVGVIVQFGGQTPLKLAKYLQDHNIPIIGTSPESIDVAEDRDKFKEIIQKIGLLQPKNYICYDKNQVADEIAGIGYPVVVRPSYVLGGRSMEIIANEKELNEYLEMNLHIFETGPLLLDSFLSEAIEVDIDAICDGEHTYIAGIMEHIEEAGVHSGDSACSLPPYTLSSKVISELEEATLKLAKALNVIGLMNIQFAIKDEDIYILEVNPRASRTIPFVAKSTNVPVAQIAARVMAGAKLSDFGLIGKKYTDNIKNHYAVKEAVFPFIRFPEADLILGPEMKSTGEGMGIDKDFALSFAKSQLSCGYDLPEKGTVFLSVKDFDKKHAPSLAEELLRLGFNIVSTQGTAKYLQEYGIKVGFVNKVLEGGPHIVDLIQSGGIQLVINTTEGKQAIRDSFSIRRTALMQKIPCCTNVSSAKALLMSLKKLKEIEKFEVQAIQEYFM